MFSFGLTQMKPQIGDPQISDLVTWNQAERLMQPAFIRLIDNFRKGIESSTWKSHYEDLQDWPEGTTEAQKRRWEVLTSQLETPAPVDEAAIAAELGKLPQPRLSYHLHLEKGPHSVQLDLWQLCYQVCFRNDASISLPPRTSEGSELATQSRSVAIDESLLTADGEVDWVQLDLKVKGIVHQILASLPAED